jgi:excisionase family DNA binding protein
MMQGVTASMSRTTPETNLTVNVEPLTVNVTEAARLSGLSEWTIRDLLNRGQVQSRRHGRRVLVAYASLAAYLDNLPE